MTSPFRLSQPDRATVEHLIEEASTSLVTYSGVGATRPGQTLPDGWHHHRFERRLGVGGPTFELGIEKLRGWQAHRGAGLSVAPEHPPIVEGTVVLVTATVAVVKVLATCRIVWTVDEPRCFGFGYGTLPVHPEKGEESFVVDWDDDDTVRFTVTAFSRRAHPLARLAGPVTDLLQRRATARYVTAMADAVSAAASPSG